MKACVKVLKILLFHEEMEIILNYSVPLLAFLAYPSQWVLTKREKSI